MGWLDRLRRGRGAGDEERPGPEPSGSPAPSAGPASGKVAVIGLDGVGLPLVQELIARGLMPTMAIAGGEGHGGPDAIVDPDHLERVVDRIHDRQEPGQARGLRLHRREARHHEHVLPELRQRPRRHALGRCRAGRQALPRAQHPEHVSGAPAGRHARVRLRGREPGAGGLSGVAAAGTQGRRLQDRRRLRERRPAAGSLLHRPRRHARGAPAHLPAAAARGAVGPLRRRDHRVRPAAPLLLEPVRRPRRAAPPALPRLLPPARRRAGRDGRGAAGGRPACSWWPITATR